MSAELSKTEYELLASFRYALRQFLRFSEEAARGAGIEPQQHQALLAVKGFPGRDWVTIGELAERLQIRHHSAVGLVNRLVAQGLLTRIAATADRRQVHVTLTEQGLALLAQLSAVHKEELWRLGPALSLLLTRLNAEDEPGHGVT
ncbi:MAG: MarR family transcriptional regulator [Chloroflexi bacterium]|nr:MarR family transcriptional regulator [Chloroflexota bacterium]